MIEKLLYFASRRGEPAVDLDRLLDELIEPGRLVRCDNIADMKHHFERPGDKIHVAMLLVADERELLELYLMRQMLFDIHLLILLPDHDEAVVALAHSLRPRFIGFISRDMQDMEKILRKTLSKKFITRQHMQELHSDI